MQTTNQVPRIAIRSIGGGLLLMALFTMMWAGIASSGLQGGRRVVELGLFSLFSIFFLLFDIYFFIASKRFPAMVNAEDKEEAKRMGVRYGIIFGMEGINARSISGWPPGQPLQHWAPSSQPIFTGWTMRPYLPY
jgi:hypothetical protein